MSRLSKHVSPPREVPLPHPKTPIEIWIDSLASEERRERESARSSLVAAGPSAVDALIACLADERPRVRWEAVKALADIADPGTVPALVERLDDTETGVRWLAAEGLARMQYDALPALLSALETRAHSQRLREGAHHVIRELHVWKLVRMLSTLQSALEKPSTTASVPVAASGALDAVREELSRCRGGKPGAIRRTEDRSRPGLDVSPASTPRS